MGRIFLGAIFTMVDINLQMENWNFDLLPDIIGYLLMFFGIHWLWKMEPYISEQTRRVKKILPICIIVSVMEDLIAVSNIEISEVVVVLVFGMCNIILSYFLWYGIILCIQVIEDEKGIELKSLELYNLLKVIIGIQAVVLIVIWFGEVLTFLAFLAMIITVMIFLVDLYYAGKRYNRW